MPNIGIDATIPLSGKDPFSSLSGMVGTMQGLQNLQTGKIQQGTMLIEQEAKQKDLAEKNNLRELLQNPQQFMDENGAIDYNKAIPIFMKAAPTLAPGLITNYLTAQKANVDFNQGLTNLDASKRTQVGQFMGSFVGQPFSRIQEGVAGAIKNNPGYAPIAEPALKFLETVNSANKGDQTALDNAVISLGRQAMPPTEQIASATPSGVGVTTGDESAVVQTRPGVPGVPQGAAVPGTLVRQRPGPTTEVFNPQKNAYGLIGNQGPSQFRLPGSGAAASPAAEAPPVPPEVSRTVAASGGKPVSGTVNPDGTVRYERGGPGGSFVQTKPALGQEENVRGTVESVNKDWGSTTESAGGASAEIGLLQNIKKFGPGAVTGVAADRQAFLTGLAGKLGISPAQLEKTNTDLLQKNTAMLAGSRNTDLARLIAESATPNTHMTPEAIQDAANQLIAQRKLALLKSQYMIHFKDDPQTYAKELVEFNKVADPRVLQLPDMDRGEKQRMYDAMSPNERNEFRSKIVKMKALGWVP